MRCTCWKRQFYGFAGSFDTGQAQYSYRRGVNSPLKNHWEFIFEVMSLTAAEYMGSSFIISSTLRMEESTVE